MGKQIIVMWCPGHSDTLGSKMADKAAGSGARAFPPTSPVTIHKVLQQESRRVLRGHFTESWSMQDPVTTKL